MNKIHSMLIRIIAAPLLAVMRTMEDIDFGELTRAVERRTARAESAVLKDYFDRHGLSGEDAERAEDIYREKRRADSCSREEMSALRERTEKAEAAVRKAELSAEMRVQMARMGVPESCAEDVLLLTSAELEKSEEKDGESVREALGAVIARLPGLAGRQLSAGSRGSFPRQDDGAALWQHQLDRARAAGDNAAAVSIITAAAKIGVSLR